MEVLSVAVAEIVPLAHACDDPAWRDAQRSRLRALRFEIRAEGADGTEALAALRQRAEHWPV